MLGLSATLPSFSNYTANGTSKYDLSSATMILAYCVPSKVIPIMLEYLNILPALSETNYTSHL